MATLGERLDAIRKNFEAEAPAEALAAIHRLIRELEPRAADAIGEGDEAPPFELPATGGETVRSADLLQRGPLVVAFFRGHW